MLKSIEKYVLVVILISIIFFACHSNNSQKSSTNTSANLMTEQLFLIGDGSASRDLISLMIEKSNISKGGYVVIIPTNYQVKSKIINALVKEFNRQGIVATHVFPLLANSKKKSGGPAIQNSDVLAIEHAHIICILDGNKNQFIHFANNTRLKKALKNANNNGALIAGFGNAASIFGDYCYLQKKDNPNVFLRPGLELLKHAVVDNIQYLNKNRNAVTNTIQNKKITFIGLDKQSMLWISEQNANVFGKSSISIVPSVGTGSDLHFGESFTLQPDSNDK